MPLTLAIDIGTTTLSAVAIDGAQGELVALATAPNTAARAPHTHGPPRAELDVPALWALARDLLRCVTAKLGDQAPRIDALGVTGQQHGVALLDAHCRPLGPAITWQDQRALEAMPGSEESHLARYTALIGGAAAAARMGCAPAAGYMGSTLHWLAAHGQLPAPPARACFVPDLVVADLTGQQPPCDPTNAAGSALFDVVAGAWDADAAQRLGLDPAILPPVRPSGSLAGHITREAAEATGLPIGTSVAVAIGDNQAGVLGSVRDPERSVLVNVGTGAQVSAVVSETARPPGIEIRPFPGGRYLLVGASLAGGVAYAALRDLFRQVGVSLYGADPDDDIYPAMNALAAAAPDDIDGLRGITQFAGTRLDPDARGSLSGISLGNLTPGHLARAVIEGTAQELYGLYRAMVPHVGERPIVVASGNGVRRNPVLARALARRFGVPIHIPQAEEAAATGAALLAASVVGRRAWRRIRG